MSNFTRDLIDTFNMNLPTIVYDSGAEAPEICYTRDSVLCLPSESFVVNCDKSEDPDRMHDWPNEYQVWYNLQVEGIAYFDQHKRYILRENFRDWFLLIANEFSHNLTSRTRL